MSPLRLFQLFGSFFHSFDQILVEHYYVEGIVKDIIKAALKFQYMRGREGSYYLCMTSRKECKLREDFCLSVQCYIPRG